MKVRITYVTLSAVALYMFMLSASCKSNVKHGNITVTPGYIKEDTFSVAKAIEEFHARYNAEDFDAIFINSIQEFQKSQSKSDMNKVMTAQRKEAGDFKSVIDKRINVIMAAPIQFRAIYVSQYNNLILTEMFTFVKIGDDFKLAWYKPLRGDSKLPTVQNN